MFPTCVLPHVLPTSVFPTYVLPTCVLQDTAADQEQLPTWKMEVIG